MGPASVPPSACGASGEIRNWPSGVRAATVVFGRVLAGEAFLARMHRRAAVLQPITCPSSPKMVRGLASATKINGARLQSCASAGRGDAGEKMSVYDLLRPGALLEIRVAFEELATKEK